MKTLYINVSGGPCAGKSTISANVFARLKMMGVNCELATEYAKDCVWNESYKTMQDQVYVFGHQYHRLWRLNGKVDVVIVDSPLPLSIIYNLHESMYFEDFIIECYKGFNNKMYFIERNEVFDNTGRVHSYEESQKIDLKIRQLYQKYNIPYTTYKNSEAADKIVAEVIAELVVNKVIK